MKRCSFMFALVLSMLFSAQMANAQAKGYAGVLAGFSVPDAENTGGRLAYGLLGGARLDGEWGFGAYFLTSSQKESVAGVKFDFDYSLYGLEGSFHMEGVADGAFVAARVGMAKVDQGTENYSPLAWGLAAGYDYFFSENMSGGLEAGFMNVQGKNKTALLELKSFTMLNFLASFKFWF